MMRVRAVVTLSCAFVAFFWCTIALGRAWSDLDALRYIASHGDLIQAFGADAEKGRSHYEQYGIREGRRITFDPNRYMASHPDLIMAFAGSEEKATRHYIEWGYREGRSTTAFDGLAYLASHADLMAVFGTDSAKATRHYIDWGYKEGRQIIFEPLAYIASYADLIAAFATDAVAGVKHYIQWGFKEGRRILFDALAYIARHADIQAAFGNDSVAATKHYINFGFKEARSLAVFISVRKSGLTKISVEEILVMRGERATLQLTPPPGYVLSSATGCGGVLMETTFSTDPILERCSIEVEFSIRPNSAPTAAAGPDFNAYLGSTVSLDGTGSSDPDEDRLTFNWLVRSYPGVFAPRLSAVSEPRPSFVADEPGDYTFELSVADGKLRSTPDDVVVTVLNSVGPTTDGTGLVLSHANNVWVFDPVTFRKSVDFVCGANILSMDKGPNNVVLGTRGDELLEVNPNTGRCVLRGKLPENLMRIAISPANDIYAIPNRLNSDGTRTLYRLSSQGAVISFAKLSGELVAPVGMDFTFDGELLAWGFGCGPRGGIAVIDTLVASTRCLTSFALGAARPAGDIDVDRNGVIRGVTDNPLGAGGGVLWRYDLNEKKELAYQSIPDYTWGYSISAIVFIP